MWALIRPSLLLVAFALLSFHSIPARADFGVAITSPKPLNANADSGFDQAPRLATDGNGNWVAVWNSDNTLGGTIGSDGDILVARSIDNGAHWSSPKPLNNNAATDAVGDFNASIAADRFGHCVAVWESKLAAGADTEIFFARSIDNGEHWSNPQPLNSNATTDSETDELPRIATDGFGHWVVVWDSLNTPTGGPGTETDIYVARSLDNGAHWSIQFPLNTNAAVDSGFDEQPDIATDGFGHWVVAWTSTDTLGQGLGTDADILVARSIDLGAHWSNPAPLNTNATSDAGADLQVSIATDSRGHWLAAWASYNVLGGPNVADSDIHAARSVDNGANWSNPTALNSNAGTDSGSDEFPSVTTDSDGNWVAVWRSADTLGGTIGPDAEILAARSNDDGTNWSNVSVFNTNATGDSGNDRYPHIATDGLGGWLVAWESEDSLGGTIGDDTDILNARFALPDCNTNGIGDRAEINAGLSPDCNHNRVPDSCEPDADTDGIIDACELPFFGAVPAGCGAGICGAGAPIIAPFTFMGIVVLGRAFRRRS